MAEFFGNLASYAKNAVYGNVEQQVEPIGNVSQQVEPLENVYQQVDPLDNVYQQVDYSSNSNVGYGGYGGYPNFDTQARNLPPNRFIDRVEINSPDYESVARKSNDVVAVVATLYANQSYDTLFRAVPQVSPDGIVAVYAINLNAVDKLLHKLEGTLEETDSVLQEMFDNIASIDSSSVVFNFECCGACTDSGFPVAATKILIGQLLQRGFMVMCSDFSVKALLGTWDAELLGPNPFIKVGEFNSSFNIRFDVNHLRDSPSAQLQKLGDLCTEGFAQLHALGGTIAFTADNGIAATTDMYKLVVFTVVTEVDNSTSLISRTDKVVEIGAYKGIVGHAMLKYPSGGILMLSCGHWIELSQVNTSEEAVLKVASDLYGDAYSANWAQQLQSASCPKAKSSMLNAYSAQIIQNSTPAQYSKCKK